ncbi:VWA domain-containing protein [Leucobacter sp. HY1910]
MIHKIITLLTLISLVLGVFSSPVAHPTTPKSQQAELVAEQPDSAGESPLIMVLDLSGSMNEEDGTGLIKLTGAKKAVSNAIRSLPAAQPFGLWQYPGGTSDCSAGSFEITPAKITDLAGTIRQVDSLIAEGGTPTGPALQATVDQLKSTGTTQATLVLVSDGESNCGEPPCAVTEQIIEDGFDVTVHAVGFRVSEAGREELDCIASVTGGKYVDVDDSDELNNEIRDMTRAKLHIEVAETLSFAGIPARITATVTNVTPISASDTRLSLDLEAGTPVNLNTLLRLGNIRGASSITKSWIVGDTETSLDLQHLEGSPGKNPQGRKFTVHAWATNADRVSAQGIVGFAASSGDKGKLGSYLGDFLRTPVEDGHPLVILGDSYSSGEGAYNYTNPPKDVSQDCHRSTATYLVPDFRPDQIVNLACSGAVSEDLTNPSHKHKAPPQLTQLDRLKKAPAGVIMSIGGNDFKFSDIITQCVIGNCDKNAEQISGWFSNAKALREKLSPVYQETWKRINTPERMTQRGGATAPVVVVAYPNLTHASRLGACGTVRFHEATVWHVLGPGEVKVANQLAAHLNAALKAAVADARNNGYEVYFVSDTADAMLPNHSLCAGQESYINGVELLGKKPSPESMHPNVAGYRATSGAIINWSRTVKTFSPDEAKQQLDEQRRREKSGIVANSQRLFVPPAPQVSLDSAASGFKPSATGLFMNGAPVNVSGEGYAPFTPVIISLHSNPTLLGGLTADEQGRIEGQVRVPWEMELGRHDLVASGTNEDGSYRETRLPISVISTPPVWVQLAPFGVGALLLGAMVMLFFWRRTLRRHSAQGMNPSQQR